MHLSDEDYLEKLGMVHKHKAKNVIGKEKLLYNLGNQQWTSFYGDVQESD